MAGWLALGGWLIGSGVLALAGWLTLASWLWLAGWLTGSGWMADSGWWLTLASWLVGSLWLADWLSLAGWLADCPPACPPTCLPQAWLLVFQSLLKLSEFILFMEWNYGVLIAVITNTLETRTHWRCVKKNGQHQVGVNFQSCITSTMNFHMVYFSLIPQNTASSKLSCKFGESECNSY